MTVVSAKWSAYVDQQHRYPSGCIGQVIGERMRQQHIPETDWTIDLLHLTPTDRVLEIGFGAGRGLALAMAQAYQRPVIGVDLSPTMLQAAARRYRRAIACDHLILVRGNIATLPFEEACFDKLFSIHTFYFWLDPHAVCKQLVGMLAHGGRLVSTFATARKRPNGDWGFWRVHQEVESLINAFDSYPNITASLWYGPDSRAYNNVAIVIDKA